MNLRAPDAVMPDLSAYDFRLQLVVDTLPARRHKCHGFPHQSNHDSWIICRMIYLLIHVRLAIFSAGVLLGALLIFFDVRDQLQVRARSQIVVRDLLWTRIAALVFDLAQIVLSVAGIVGTVIALRSPPDVDQAVWIKAVTMCHLQVLVGNYVRSTRPSTRRR